MGTGSCHLSGTGVLSGNCFNVSANNTIKIKNLNSSSNNINPLTLNLTLPIVMSQSVATYNFGVNTLSNGSIVDTGSASLTTVGRQLANS